MKIEIEEYRGWTIYFDTDKDEFYCHSDQWDREDTKRTFTACKKYIDEFIKTNSEFKPFLVESKPDIYRFTRTKLKVVGIRKDGRFVHEGKDGKPEQISEYNNKDYILVESCNDPLWAEIEGISNEIESLNIQRRGIVANFKIKTLEQIKKEL
jgi:hypothetical protein